MSSEHTLDLTNGFAHQYDEYVKDCHWVGPEKIFKSLSEYICPNQKLLDIGMGTGLASIEFFRAGLKIYGVDGSSEMIKVAEEKSFTEEIKLVDISKEKNWFSNISFNHVISHGLFHLIGSLDNIFKETSTLLSNKGFFVFTFDKYNSEKDYKKINPTGVYEKKMDSGIMTYKHSESYILNLLKLYKLKFIESEEFLAFIDLNTKVKTFFEFVLAKKTN